MGNLQGEQKQPLSDEELELRRKDWADLTDTQKIERQRDIIKDLQRSVGFMQQQLLQLQTNFNQHQHSEKGIMVPLLNNGLMGGAVGGLAKLANPNYF